MIELKNTFARIGKLEKIDSMHVIAEPDQIVKLIGHGPERKFEFALYIKDTETFNLSYHDDIEDYLFYDLKGSMVQRTVKHDGKNYFVLEWDGWEVKLEIMMCFEDLVSVRKALKANNINLNIF